MQRKYMGPSVGRTFFFFFLLCIYVSFMLPKKKKKHSTYLNFSLHSHFPLRKQKTCSDIFMQCCTIKELPFLSSSWLCLSSFCHTQCEKSKYNLKKTKQNRTKQTNKQIYNSSTNLNCLSSNYSQKTVTKM